MARTGRYKRYPIAGTATMAAALFLLSTMDPTTSFVEASLYMLLLGLGLGLVIQVLVVAVQNAVSARDLGVATSSASFFRSLGGAFGTALFGTIFSSRLASHLAELIPQGTAIPASNITGSPALIAQLPVHDAVIEAFSLSLTATFAAAIPIALAGLILVILLPELPLGDTTNVAAAQAKSVPDTSPESVTPQRPTRLHLTTMRCPNRGLTPEFVSFTEITRTLRVPQRSYPP